MVNDAACTSGGLRILVTGAAGLLGRELCAALARRGHGVVALLHRSAIAPRDGTITRPYDGAAVPGSVALLNGDVAAERFGLAASLAHEVASGLDLIVHCAALTAFTLPDALYERVNVGGTAHVLAFAALAGPAVPVLHVSTAFVCGIADGVVEETATTAVRFNNGYEASKAASEALVLRAHRQGHRMAIARPSIVTGSAETGAIGAFGNLYQLVRFVAEGRTGALPAAPHASLNLVPIDHVVAAMTDIAERMPAANGRIFHLAATEPVDLTALGALTAAFPHLAAPCFVAPDRFDPARLSPRQRWLQAQMMAPYACYLRPSPGFVTANLASLSGRRCPPTDGAYLRRMVGYALQAGFLKSAAAARR